LLIIYNSIDTKNACEDNVMAEVKELGVSWNMDWRKRGTMGCGTHHVYL
jgi:hypothetical protein